MWDIDKQNLHGILEIVRKEICLILKDPGEFL
jgi:hypothetical protein